ncbi:O-antigen polysaccharide polymerase Wzy [Pseudidiomarina salilacus]|uniref:O-antigen polysaccharide polymerase Wzy n=1 Tax=Pseudidiomarina salilacus TaxID=3384452 RepID=UPI003984AA52
MYLKIYKILISSFFCSVSLVTLIFGGMDIVNRDLLAIIALLSILLVFLPRFFVSYRSKYRISIFGIFLASYSVVYFWVPIQSLFGIELPSKYYWFVWVDEESSGRALLLSIICFHLINLGNIFFSKNNKLSRESNREEFSEECQSPKGLHVATIEKVLLAFAFVFYLLFLATSGSYLAGQYFAGDAAGINSYYFKLFNVFIGAAIIYRNVRIINRFRNDSISLISYLELWFNPIGIIVAVHLVFSLIVGDRGPVISYALLMMCPYLIRVGNFKLRTAVVWILTGVVVMSFIGEVRSLRFDYEDLSTRIGVVTESWLSGSSIDEGKGLISDLSFSFRALAKVVDEVPSNYNHQYGLLSVSGLTSTVPGLNGFILAQTSYSQMQRIAAQGSATFVTFLFQGNSATYGDGTSVLVDAYIDFGVLGMLIFAIILGGVIARLDAKLSDGYITLSFLTVMAMHIFSKSIYLARSSIYIELSYILLMYLTIMILKSIVGRKDG